MNPPPLPPTACTYLQLRHEDGVELHELGVEVVPKAQASNLIDGEARGEGERG